MPVTLENIPAVLANDIEMQSASISAQSRVFRLSDLPVHHSSNGNETLNILHGRLPTGEQVSLHESTQPAGAAPNPTHRIAHSEIICLRQGMLEFQHDGDMDRANSGDVLFVAKGTMHRLRNIGTIPARYFVLAVGGDINEQ